MDNRRESLTTVNKLESEGYEFIAMSGDEPGDDWKYTERYMESLNDSE